ncbi:MAG: prepilin-type N-terminal cleavage/methylation domain-containing protein [Verrucomicrobia bacterium]|nr:prepilin-type N-terminal cleavage/methylation domain-containing protein [Verrucomicrobiota bacterium]MCH8510910.1 prepilin-type N-terminal cleavage/methylation domain-containing protein [Kiritimatiellia bacterium]
MMNNSPKQGHRRRAGFTLAEILLAMLVFAIAITTILALLARSIETVDEIVLRDEAMRLSSAVESFMRDLPFNEAYEFVRNESVYLQGNFYSADPNRNLRVDGTMWEIPITDRNQAQMNAGEDFLVAPVVRPNRPFTANNGRAINLGAARNLAERDYRARMGRYFQIRLVVSETNPIAAADMPSNPDDYESAVIVVYAEFYPMPTWERVFSDNPNARPVYSYNFAVRR